MPSDPGLDYFVSQDIKISFRVQKKLFGYCVVSGVFVFVTYVACGIVVTSVYITTGAVAFAFDAVHSM